MGQPGPSAESVDLSGESLIIVRDKEGCYAASTMSAGTADRAFGTATDVVVTANGIP